jgi:hypothetical protein
MRKVIVSLALITLLTAGGCRWVSYGLWHIPKWIEGGVLNVYTGNGHYDGKMRWDNFTQNYQKIQNVIDIYFFNYDIRDPWLGAPFFGDPH